MQEHRVLRRCQLRLRADAPVAPAAGKDPAPITTAATLEAVQCVRVLLQRFAAAQLTRASVPFFLVQANWNKPLCSSKSACKGCSFAWRASAKNKTVTVYLSEPAQISRVFIKQLRNEGLIKVETLAWTGAKGVVGAATTVYDVPRKTPNGVCLSVQAIRIGPAKSAIRKPVPRQRHSGTGGKPCSVSYALTRLQHFSTAVCTRKMCTAPGARNPG